MGKKKYKKVGDIVKFKYISTDGEEKISCEFIIEKFLPKKKVILNMVGTFYNTIESEDSLI